MYYRRVKDSLLKVSMGALMAAEKSPIRTLMIGPIVLTWARHSDTDVETYLRLMRESLTAQYDTNTLCAKAWDEGFDAGERDAFDVLENPDHECIRNPYRKGEEA